MERRWFAMALALLTAVPMQLYFGDAPVYAAAVQSGQCGENAYWEYADGALTINGAGAVTDEAFEAFKTEIKTITIEGDITEIGQMCFSNCTQLSVLDASDSRLELVGFFAFTWCTNLETVSLPGTLRRIESGGFMGCEKISSLMMPDDVSLGTTAFYDARMLMETVGDFQIFNGTYLYRYNEPLTADLVPYEIVIPDGITVVCERAFLKNINDETPAANIGRIVLPEGLKRIDANAFESCVNLEDIVIPESIEHIDWSLFDNCPRLLANCTKDGLTVLSDRYLVRYTGSIPGFFIPDQIQSVVGGAFSGNKDLLCITCPDTLREINEEAFADCGYLMRLELNDGLERIGTNALSGCTRLNSLTIPASVTEIGMQENCSLRDIYGVPGSEAERFALANGIAFHDLAELEGQPGQSGTTDFDYTADGWSFGNSREAFNNEFYLTAEDLAAVQAITSNKFYAEDWGGACFGLSLTVILAKNGLFPLDKLQPGAQTLSEIEPTPQVQSFINYYHAVQFSSAYLQSAAVMAQENPVQRLGSLVIAAKNLKAGESPFLLEFAYSGGWHAVVVYGYESGEWTYNGQTYDGRILVWDPNVPDRLYEDSCLYYSSVTFDHCIPFYNLQYSGSEPERNSGNIIHFCNDLDVLNAYPYSFARTGDLNGDGVLTVADAVLLARVIAEDPAAKADLAQADIDADGLWTILDVQQLLQKLI